jgi:YD repeat-containing protein
MNMKKIVSLIVLACIFLLCLTSCGGSKYDRALRLIEKGKYEAAYELLEQLGDDEKAQKLKNHFYYLPVACQDDIDGETTEWTYNENNLPIQMKTVHADGRTILHEFTYDAKGNLTLHTYKANGATSFSQDYTYDANNRVARYIYTGASGNTEVYEYEYDANGNKIRESVTYDEKILISECVYDSNGNRIKQTYTASNGEITVYEYTFDANGNLTKEQINRPDGTSSIFENIYDENNCLIKEIITSYSGEQYSLEHAYAANGERIKTTLVSSDGTKKVTQEEQLTYDAKGNIIKRVSISSGSNTATSTREYVYDDNNNVIKETINGASFYEYRYVTLGDEIKQQIVKYVSTNENGEKTTIEYTYDENGKQIKRLRTHADGQTDEWSKQYEWFYIPYDLGEVSNETTMIFHQYLRVSTSTE